MSDFALTEDQYNEVLHLSKACHREVNRYRDSKAYLAGCVMVGAALEDTLLVFANCYPDEATRSTHAPAKKGTIKSLAQWPLAEILAVVN